MKAWPDETAPPTRPQSPPRSSPPVGIPIHGGAPAVRPRMAQTPRPRAVYRDPATAGRTALTRLAETAVLDDALTVSVLRFAARHGHRHHPARLLAHWRTRAIGHPGVDTDYPWTLSFDSRTGSEDYASPEESSALWRPREVDAYLRNPTAYGRRLVGPIVLSEALQFLAEVAESDETGVADAPKRLLDEVRPRIEREVASYIQGDDPWRDTFVLWLLATRPQALEMLDPLARAIATRYATMASWTAGLVCGIRYPFDGVPLVSACAHLAHGLWSLGYNPRALPGLLAFIAEAQGRSGGWADDGQPEDVLTSLAAADLLCRVDPGFDPHLTIDFLARLQEPGGWWRALDPEVPWLTGAVVEWLDLASRPFQERFTWPGYERTSRDRRTRLPWWAAYGDTLVRTFERVPGLSAARTEVAFLDLANFGLFNTQNGQARGDEVLRVLGRALATIPGSRALRDGGDEFILVGTPTDDGLEGNIREFMARWPAIFRNAFPEAERPVVPRIVVTSSTGSRLETAREALGRAIGRVKGDYHDPGPDGILIRI